MLDQIPLTFILIGANVVVYMLVRSDLMSNAMMYRVVLWPLASEYFYPWQLISYGFVHASLSHLFFNMFALYMFGLQLEALWGSNRFGLFYLVGLLGASILQLIVAAAQNAEYPTLGASGAVFAILLGFGVTWPDRRILLIIPPIPIKAKWFVLGYGGIELFLGLTGLAPGIAHFAHLGGMVGAAALLYHWGWRPFK